MSFDFTRIFMVVDKLMGIEYTGVGIGIALIAFLGVWNKIRWLLRVAVALAVAWLIYIAYTNGVRNAILANFKI